MRARSFAVTLLALAACATGQVVTDIPDTGTPVDGGTGDSGCSGMCSGKCVDLKTDNANCGTCGTACSSGASCVQGTCQCKTGSTKCGSACVDLKVDNGNCGTCGQACGGPDASAPMGGGTWSCVNGTCSVVCPMPKTDCSGACADLKTDTANCGTCGKSCAVSETCTEGLCCKAGEKACSNKCTAVMTDPMNCGMCGNVCPMNTPACVGGTCTNAPCSTVAKNYCTGMGWTVVTWSTSWPNQPGGSIFCTSDGRSAGSDCDTCTTYKQIVWKSTAKDACSSTMALQAGQIYSGHSPCTCLANNLSGGSWPMNGCTPD